MIEFKGNNKFINKHRLTSFSVTYPRTVNFYTGVCDDQSIIHNLIIKTKSKISEKNSNMTYVRGNMTGWYDFINDIDFAKFFTKTMNEIKPLFAPHNPLDKELKVINAWGNSLTKGNIVEIHTHRDWHGILYLTEGAPLHFPEMNMTFTPKPGHWILSPPEIQHGTEEIQGDKERVCIVFNFNLDDKFRQVNEKHDNTEEWKKVKDQL